MHSQFYINKTLEPNMSHLTLHKCILVGNWLMIISALITASCITLNFGFEQSTTLSIQIAGHIATIVFAAIFKIGYVVRCIGAHGLGHKAY